MMSGLTATSLARQAPGVDPETRLDDCALGCDVAAST